MKGRNLKLYADAELRQQALNTIAVESRNGGFRIAKERASKKIDSTVALSMACVAALKRMNRSPLIFRGGYDVPDLTVDETQKRLDEETREAVAASAASVEETVRRRGVWGSWIGKQRISGNKDFARGEKMPTTKLKPKGKRSKRDAYRPPSPEFLRTMVVKGWRVTQKRGGA